MFFSFAFPLEDRQYFDVQLDMNKLCAMDGGSNAVHFGGRMPFITLKQQ